MTTDKSKELIDAFQRDFRGLQDEMGKLIAGYEEVLENMLICFFAGGNLLIESPAGLGKTLIAKTLANVMDVRHARVQFTPDLMPADIIGTTVVQEGADGRKHFVFQKGPVFTQLLMADEINRATPKTQSALLEAMQERHVTTGGKTYMLDKPYFVIATLNNEETEGTYVLPEAQLDRFFFRLRLPRPDIDHLQAISQRNAASGTAGVNRIIDGERARRMQGLVLSVKTPEEARHFAIQVILRTHSSTEESGERIKRYLLYGASPRGVQGLILGGKVRALLAGRAHVEPEDIAGVAKPVLGHRLVLNFEGEADNIQTDDLIDEVLAELLKKKEPAAAKPRNPKAKSA